MINLNPDLPFNDLPLLPPDRAKVETIAVLRQIGKAAAALGELKGLANTLPNPNILLNAVILREATASSEIENIITTQDRLYQALSAKGVTPDPATKEVLRYREALLTGYRFLQDRGYISTNAIVQIQEVLEENSAGIRRLPGTALRNSATGATIYTPPDDHDTVLRLMKNLEDYLNMNDDGLSPLVKLAIQHYQFESIHPFYDGNGRTGRIMNVLFLIANGLLDKPVLYLSQFIIEHKADYYRLLQEVRTKENWEEWVLFVIRGVELTARETIESIGKINDLFLKYQDDLRQQRPKIYSKDLLELLFEQPYARIDQVVERLGVSRPTATRYLRELTEAGFLTLKQVWKESLFVNHELFDLLKK